MSTMNATELIVKKRDGGTLSREEIEDFITGFLHGEVPDYQMAAFLMAVYYKGMSAEETAHFASVMLRSGKTIDLSSIPGRKVDKHSTGGVGDKVSLILAPMVAACGVPVPMISGRGLAHTGGTLDKLDSIPGFRTELSIEEFQDVLRETGLALAGQTSEIAPADRRMYALRDVTGTVESIPLIAGSIMSKKLAEGLDALVLDVKTGNGAFMEKEEDAIALAKALIGIGTSCGKEVLAFITSMDQPLGMTVGNWCEVVEAVECLKGKNVPDLMEVTYVLGGAMVYLGGRASGIAQGIVQCRSAIWSGRAYELFLRLVERQGGDAACLRDPGAHLKPRVSRDVRAHASGYLTGFATKRIGLLAVALGAGRRRMDDPIEPQAGIILARKIGDRVAKGDLLATIVCEREDLADHAAHEYALCVTISDTLVPPVACVKAIVDKEGIRPWKTPETY